MAAIEIKNIKKTYRDITLGRDVEALKDMNITIEEGDFVIFLGPRGCGKSTLLNIIAGLIPHEPGGEVLVDGIKVTRPNPDKMAYMFQDSVLFPWRTCVKNVEFGLERKKMTKAERRERALKYIKMVGLEDFSRAYPRQLSGGMCQRTALCRALAMETEIILMDEPFGALDEQTRIILGDELIDIWRKVKRTIVFVTHSLSEAVYLGERILVFTARPGVIKATFNVEIPRPRTLESIEFRAVVEKVWNELKEESLKAARREKEVSEAEFMPLE